MDRVFFTNLKESICKCRRNSTISAIHNALNEWLRLHRRECCGEPLPPISRIAGLLGVARQTVRKVYLRLEEERLICRRPNERLWFIRSFRKSSLQNIALILPAMFSDYYPPSTEYGQRRFGVYSGIADRAMEQGYALVPYRLPPPGASRREIAAAIEEIKQNYVGVIHLGERRYEVDLPLAELTAQKDLPQIAIDCDFGLPWIGSVTFDSGHTAHSVASYLRENGHRRIGIVYPSRTVPKKIPDCRYMMNDRKAVLEPFLNEPMKFDRIFEIVSGPHCFGERSRKQIRNVIDAPEPPTAFWCRNDISAMELIRVLKEFGCSVPEDFSVIGFDDLPAARIFDPPLTTLRNPVYELGYTAMLQLDRYIMYGLGSIERVTRLAPVLCIRRSVGAKKDFPMEIQQESKQKKGKFQ